MDSNVNSNSDSEDDILNHCGPAITFYESQLDENYKNDTGDCDDVETCGNHNQ